MSKQKEFHCWFSKKMHDSMNEDLQSRTDAYYYINGVPTLITNVTAEKKDNCHWDDMAYLGVGTYAYNKKR
jgi:hypothetical protein